MTTTETSGETTAVAGADTVSLARRIEDARREFEEFRTAVRNEVIAIHEAGTWCLDGSNAALDDLDLPPLSNRYTGTVTITVDVTVRNAAREDTAMVWIRNALNVDSHDEDVDVTDINIDAHPDLTKSHWS